DVPANDTSTTYSLGNAFVSCALDSPIFNPGFRANLFVTWKEYYITEAEWDICRVLVSDDGVNWTVIRPGVSGVSDGWQHRTVDITSWWRSSPSPFTIQVRFEFQTLNNINNEFGGWYVDDVNVYGTPEVRGTVRNVNGTHIEGAIIYAIGSSAGITNLVSGHSYVYPGHIFATAVTDAHGQYELRGMPQGNYYIKCSADGYRSEFWDDTLFPGPYIAAFGNPGVNPGKYDIRDVSAAGILDLTALSTSATCNYELDPGLARGNLVVQVPGLSAGYSVYLNQGVVSEKIWNGTATSNGAALIDYTTDVPDSAAYPAVDWVSNPVQPPEISDIMA
ncbi:hypothetical protein BVX97_00865, partial [bacterium E08(2017)]